MADPQLVDRWGRPLERKVLKTEVAAATLGGVRSPMAGYPGDGLNPVRLAQILREADAGDPLRYLELAETIEERDLHYLGVLSTRKRSVSQLEITVEAGSDDPVDIEIADRIRDWLARDELADETFDILDAVGKGYSFTEILWDTSEGQWVPARLEYRDPRWFRFDRRDLRSPMLISDGGALVPLPAGKFIHSRMRAKSGLEVRSGLARIVAWAWMFKAFTQRDWAIFTQTYGQPLRLGKWASGASEADKDTLFQAVANIAGDCGAIIPDTMSIEFIETGSVGASGDLYERRSDWLDRQVSKAVLGQTTTTDAVSGGHAVSKEHRLVQEDIERADAKALASVLNQDLIRPWIILEFGARPRLPKLRIERPEAEDVERLARSLAHLVPLGLRVSESEVRNRFGLGDPAADARVLTPPGTASPAAQVPPPPPPAPSLNAAAPQAPETIDQLLTEALTRQAQPQLGPMIETLRAMLDGASSLEEFRERLAGAFPALEAPALTETMAQGLMAANLAGQVAARGGDDGNA